MKIIAFLKSTMRTATALFLATCAVALVVGVGVFAHDWWKEAQAKEYESVKLWATDTKTHLQFALSAQTKLVNNRLLLKLETDSYPEYLRDPKRFEANATRILLLNFLDKDGFNVFSKSMTVRSFTTTVDADGKPIGMKFEGSELMDVPTYASMAKLDVQWNIDTQVPTVSTVASPPEMLDYCAPNLSKTERLRRLGLHGNVRQTGEASYAVGYRTIAFFTGDNTLLDCR